MPGAAVCGPSLQARASATAEATQPGYADGIPAALPSGMGHVGLHGGLAPIVGSVCMDQLMVDVTGLPPVKQGDIATLFGPGGPSAYDLAAAAGLTTNALLSSLGPRLPRIVASTQ